MSKLTKKMHTPMQTKSLTACNFVPATAHCTIFDFISAVGAFLCKIQQFYFISIWYVFFSMFSCCILCLLCRFIFRWCLFFLCSLLYSRYTKAVQKNCVRILCSLRSLSVICTKHQRNMQQSNNHPAAMSQNSRAVLIARFKQANKRI